MKAQRIAVNVPELRLAKEQKGTEQRTKKVLPDGSRKYAFMEFPGCQKWHIELLAVNNQADKAPKDRPPLAACGSPFGRGPEGAINGELEMKDQAGRNPQILLRLRTGAGCGEAGQQVIHLDRTNGEMFSQFGVNPATYRHGEAIV